MSSKYQYLARVFGLAAVIVSLAVGTANAASNSTPAGLRADGLRLQGLAQFYERQQNGSTPLGLKADGLRLQAMAKALQVRTAASFYTPQALKAEGLRWQAMADAYGVGTTPRRSSSSSSTGGFDWSAAVVGAVSMLGFATVGAALLLGARRVRRTRVAV
jgi:hypothetical protein